MTKLNLSNVFLMIFSLPVTIVVAETIPAKYTKSDLRDCTEFSYYFSIDKDTPDSSRLFFKDAKEGEFTSKNSDVIIEFPYEYDSIVALEVEISEEKRKSKISQDYDVIKSAIKKKQKSVDGIKKLESNKKCLVYKQKYKRSEITVTSKVDPEEESAIATSLLAGPEERWAMSLDVPFNKIEQLKFDDTSNQIVEKETPSKVYLGVNYHLDDLYMGTESSKWALKFMLPIQKDPTEALGLGISREFSWGTLFVAGIHVLSEDTDTDGNLGHTNEFLIGISFDLSHGASWFE